MEDDEKYGKIKNEQAKSRMHLLVFAGLCALVGGYILKTRARVPAAKQLQVHSSAAVSGGTPILASDGPIRAVRASEVRMKVSQLQHRVDELDAEVRAIKKTGVIMETDERSLEATKKLQDATRELIVAKYGKHPAYRVKVTLEFPPTIPDYSRNGKDGQLVIEMAPVELIPVSVYTFLEIARTWLGGEFHRNAAHVLQATTRSSAVRESLPFQEYSAQFPHVFGTTGYCGRPSGPCWYISIKDNSKNHGPGSQQKHNPYEADANFGKIVEGMTDVVPRIHMTKETGWLSKPNQVKITTMTVMVPTGPGGAFEPWKEEL